MADEPNRANREALLLGKTFMTYRRDLCNLALQERRLRNQRQADIAELQQLQKERIEKRQSEIQHAALAQLVEHYFRKVGVVGSIPMGG